MKRVLKKVTALGLGATLVATSSFLSTNAWAASSAPTVKKQSITLEHKVKALQDKMGDAKTSPFSEDTFLVKYSPSFSVGTVKGNGRDFNVIEKVDKLQYMVIKVRQKDNLAKVMEAFQKNSRVLSVSRSALYKTYSGFGDPKKSEQYQLSQLKIDEAQKLAGKHKVTVAVIDTGVDKNHPELKGIFTKDSYNVINPMGQGTPDVHGTHVSGIIAAKKGNGIGGYGINPNVNILSIDVFDRGFFTSDYTIAQGILYAVQHGAKVINMSLGSSVPSPLLEEAVKSAISKGVTIVASAGNNGNDAPNYPASYEGVISVGSVNKSKQLSYYSSYGPSLDIVAPGENIYAPIYDLEKKSSFETLSGTSMASPMVAGTASLLLSKYPNLKPEQVEYILEHTATDLGAKGYDLKYGNGLVNPVAALKYNVKKLPTFVKSTWSKKEILEKAAPLAFSSTISKEGNITKPFEQKWYQFRVEKGEYIQTQLTSAPEYDNKLMIRFYSEDGSQSQTMDVNDVRAGKTEGKLVKAPFSGTIAIGVKDVNGNYDDSSSKKSKYKLSLTRTIDGPQSESTLENPLEVKGFPYQSGPLKLFGENGDDDYFTFKTNDEQVVRMTVSGIPGVTSAIEVYTKESLGLPTGGEADQEQPSSDDPAPSIPIDQVQPQWQTNSSEVGSGETLTIPTTPQTEYIVKVTNKVTVSPWDFWSFMGSGISFMGKQAEPQSSLLPYTLNMEGKVIPPDEDTLPIQDDGQNQNNYIQTVLDNALPYTLGGTISGYIQTGDDEDWYKFVPSKTGVYQFTIPQPASSKPYVEVMKVVKEKDDKGKPYLDAEIIGFNDSYDYNGFTMAGSFYTGLKKGETYLIHLSGNPFGTGNISFDPYKLQTKLIETNLGKTYGYSNGEAIKNISTKTFQGTFAMPYEDHLFYLEGKKSAVYSLLFEGGKPSPELLRKYPKELLSDVYGVAIIYEDVNKNRKLDDADIERGNIIATSLYTGSSTNYGSFKVTKGKNYIIDFIGLIDGIAPISLVPYKATVVPVATKDEDKGSVVKKNVPSKPLKLKKVKTNTWTATGQLNSGVAFGDDDWYVLDLKKDFTGYISLETGKEVDGVISLYQNGKRIQYSNYYGAGQTEAMPVKLKKGKYYIKVNDFFGNSTITPYTLKVGK
ncbi:S8 family serine peptidase [Bacillus sp. FJAT-49736]|uniref:S8 family peptidase n=1 Tax=Bacillus sp. FJAT-49736 TaxID=2833582 RepID=UPI001BC947B2|nr:S8 family serine peptidase [Bacillus sp. FJAT-49736]MBS4174344.1 S8 family serine peptidase [Bacillus sp. FJAT-49736]